MPMRIVYVAIQSDLAALPYEMLVDHGQRDELAKRGVHLVHGDEKAHVARVEPLQQRRHPRAPVTSLFVTHVPARTKRANAQPR